MAAAARTSALGLLMLLAALSVIQGGWARAHVRHHRGEAHCSRCGPGWGAVERCSRGRDTVCAECQPGTYSPHHGTQPCWICSRCGPGLYEARRCGPATDTVCDSCHRRAPGNPDYDAKCAKEARLGQSVFLAPEDASSTGQQSRLVNQDEPAAGADPDAEATRYRDAQAQLARDANLLRLR